jgi:hypothetical protein
LRSQAGLQEEGLRVEAGGGYGGLASALAESQASLHIQSQ